MSVWIAVGVVGVILLIYIVLAFLDAAINDFSPEGKVMI
jgi:hypothetical protein